MLSNTRLVAGGGLLAVVVALGFGVWWLFVRDDAPPAVNLGDAVAAAQASPTATVAASTGTVAPTETTTEPSAVATVSTTATESPTTDGSATRADGLTGTWVLSDQGESFAGYRIEEELASIGSNTAVGRSSAIEATLEFDGSAITSVEVVVDMTQLTSDDSRRDGQLETRAIETNSFPTATFALTSPINLDTVPEEGVPIAMTAVGDLTLHGVTRSVEVALEGQRAGGLLIVIGSVDIALVDYDIEPPTGFSVLSVADAGVMEFQLVFE